MGPNAGKVDVGETVASFSDYEKAQKAVASLLEADIPPRDIAIVGSGLRSVERITGKLGYVTAARSGLINGLLLGFAAAAMTAIFNPASPPQVYFGTVLVCMALGMALAFMSYLIMRKRRSFASVMAVVSEHYDVSVLPASIHRAREAMGKISGKRAQVTREIDSAPPQYGERLPDYGKSDAPVAPATQPGEAPASPAVPHGAPATPPRTPNGDDVA